MRRLVLLALVVGLGTRSVTAQGYRVRIDTRWQSVAYRGVSLDSIPVADTVSNPGGDRKSTRLNSSH